MGSIIFTSYISHGAPTSLVERTGIHDIYEGLGRLLTKHGVDTVIVCSPHYLSRRNFEIDSRSEVPCIQDYYGFPEELYKFTYEAHNNTELVSSILNAAKEKDLPVAASTEWGLDHGAWLPLYFMFPDRREKVVPVSISGNSPEEHFRFGEAIRAAVQRTDGTFAVLGTGSPVHRLDLIRFGYYGEEKFEPGDEFDRKLIGIVGSGDFGRILKIGEEIPAQFRAAAPEGALKPLFVALGASGKEDFIGTTLFHEFMYYGVSLVVTVLSARPELRGDLTNLRAPDAAHR